MTSGPMTHFRLKPEVVLQEWLTPHSTWNTQIILRLCYSQTCKNSTSGFIGLKTNSKPENDQIGRNYAKMKA